MAIKVEAFRLSGRVEVDNKRARASLRETEGDAKSLNKSFQGLRGEIGRFNGSMKEAAGGLPSGGTFGIGEMLKMLPGLGTLAGAVTKVGGALAGVGKIGFDFNRTMEEGQIAFEVMLKDVGKAKSLLGELDKMSIDSPFDLTKLVDSTPKLLAFKFEVGEIARVLTAAGDAAGTNEQKFDTFITQLGQIKTKGRATTEELISLVDAGIPAFDYLGDEIARVDKRIAALTGDKRTEAVRQMVERGALSARGTVEALLRGVERERGGLGKRMANETAGGLESQFRDSLGRTLGKSTTSAFEGYKGLLRTGTALISSETVQGFAGGLNDKLGTMINAGARMGQAVVDGARSKEGQDSNSPSRKMFVVGLEAAAGYGGGFVEGMGKVRGDVAAQMRGVVSFTQGAASGQAKRWTREQIENARKIVEIGKQVGASEKQIRAALSAGIVESRLRNLPHGDRDSLGIMQQRPSQGWGSRDQVTNVDYAIRKFFEAAMTASQNGTPGQLAQRVQRSAFPRRYDQHMPQADELLAQFSGGSLPVTVQNFSQLANGTPPGHMDELSAGLAAAVGDDLRAATAERERTHTALVAATDAARERWEWAKGLPEGTPGEKAVKASLVEGAWQRMMSAQNAHAEAVTSLDARIAELNSTLRELATAGRAAGGLPPVMASHSPYAATNAARGVFTSEPLTTAGQVAGVDSLTPKSFTMLPPAVRELSKASIDALPPIKGLIETLGKADKILGAFSQIAGMLPGGQQVGKKRGFFSKMLGFAAPFLNFIPGVGPILSTLASIGSSALGGDYGGALMGAAGGLSTGGAFRRAASVGSGSTQVPVSFTNPAGGARALGGPVRRGTPYLVGERRAEVFTPNEDGWIHPDAGRYGGRRGGGSEGGGSEGGGNFWRQIMEQLRQSIEQSNAIAERHATALGRFESMPPDQVVVTGARTNAGRRAIAEGYHGHVSRDASALEFMARRMNGV
jgi:hypothetical protein